MSFEAVAALARDNGFQMVIVVAGSSTRYLSSRRIDCVATSASTIPDVHDGGSTCKTRQLNTEP